MALGLVAFIFDTAGGVLFAKLMNAVSKDKVNPMIGAAGISAFPMSSRIVQRMAKEADPTNFLLMQATSANVSGQLASVIAGGVILQLVPILMERLA
jgi:oxaloacetate decarboxylase beta subunit